jgi:hypothetical protein
MATKRRKKIAVPDYDKMEKECKQFPFAKTLQSLANNPALSSAARKFFADMSLAEWKRWRDRYILLTTLAENHSAPPSDMTQYECELFPLLPLFPRPASGFLN